MARVCKENINTSFFHIMVQGNNKEYIFNSIQDINQYMKIMKDTQFVFMENEVNKEEICKELVEEIITKNHITKEELCQNEALLRLAIKKLKYENSISYRMMETILGVNRKKLKRMENSDL